MSSSWNWKLAQRGKVRDVYVHADNEFIALVASDRVSAFDYNLPVEIEGKGKILTKMSAFWFEWLEDVLPDLHSAFITIDNEKMSPFFRKPEFEGRVTIMKKLKMLPVEAIVRGHITGSIWKAYKEGARSFCGLGLHEGLRNSDKFPQPLFTPTTKAPEGEHDKNINFNEMVSILDQAGYENSTELADDIQEFSLQLYDHAYTYALEHDIILADTKFEFGLDRYGTLHIADELFTPDSSRFWPREGFKDRIGKEQPSMDKQIIRDYVAEHQESTEIPEEILHKTKAQYEKCLELLTT